MRFAEGFVGGDRDAVVFLPFGEDLEQQLGAALVEFHVSEFVDAQQVDPAVAGDGLGQLAVVGGLDELVDELGGQHVAEPVAVHRGLGAQADQQVAFAGARRDSDRLQHLRSVLPCEVRVTSVTHPLSGRVVAARSFKWLNGVLLLVIGLPDGSPGTIAAAATDVFGPCDEVVLAVVLDAAGWRRLRELSSGLAGRRAGNAQDGQGQIGSPRP